MRNPVKSIVSSTICLLLLSLLPLDSGSLNAFAGKGSVVTKRPAIPLSADEQQAAARLNLDTIRQVTTDLTAKEMEGRGTAQPGADRAARYVAEWFARLGLKPGGDSSTYLQSIDFKIDNMLPQSGLKVGGNALQYKTDFAFSPPYPATENDVSGGVVFVGYGVVSQALKHDDLAGMDVKGKIVVLLDGKPKKVDSAAWSKASDGEEVYGRLILKGAVGFLVNQQDDDENEPGFKVYPESYRLLSLAEAPPSPFKVPPVVLISDAAGEKIFAKQGKTLATLKKQAEAGKLVSRDLGVNATISPRMRREMGKSSNVIGSIEGSDPKLKSEAVVYTAHYDAFGVDYQGSVYPGAADNALGVGKLIAIAQVLAAMPTKPRRSIIFMATTAEEYNMSGAEHWLMHPTWPLDEVAADINFDGIGTDVVGKLGFVLDMRFDDSDLGKLIRDITAAFGIKVIPDQWPDVDIFYRADHYRFVERGIPALYLLGGPHGKLKTTVDRAGTWLVTNYHQPGDTVQPSWKWDGARELAAIALIAGLRVADQDSMPSWKPDAPYNHPRGSKPASES